MGTYGQPAYAPLCHQKPLNSPKAEICAPRLLKLFIFQVIHSFSTIMPGPGLSAKEAVAKKTLCMVLVLQGLRVWWRSQAVTHHSVTIVILEVMAVCLEVEYRRVKFRAGKVP